MAIYSGFTHKKWWFSIVMLVYQRVIIICLAGLTLFCSLLFLQDRKSMEKHRFGLVLLYVLGWFSPKTLRRFLPLVLLWPSEEQTLGASSLEGLRVRPRHLCLLRETFAGGV